MWITIKIPEEFEEHFYKDNFKDSLLRLSMDAHCLGNYEKETILMLIKALENAIIE